MAPFLTQDFKNIFDSKYDSEIIEITLKNSINYDLEVFIDMDQKIIKFLDRALQKNQNDRMTIRDCLRSISSIIEC